jgi:hypothetical protein
MGHGHTQDLLNRWNKGNSFLGGRAAFRWLQGDASQTLGIASGSSRQGTFPSFKKKILRSKTMVFKRTPSQLPEKTIR